MRKNLIYDEVDNSAECAYCHGYYTLEEAYEINYHCPCRDYYHHDFNDPNCTCDGCVTEKKEEEAKRK